jgi:rod shape-determining protein MreB
MSQGIRAFFATDWTIDLGSSQIAIGNSRRPEPWREPALAARPELPPGRARTGKRAMMWTGEAALIALREQSGLRAVRPVQHGRVVNPEALDLLLEGMLRRARGAAGWTRWFPSVTGMLVPPGLSRENRMRSRDLAQRQGLGHVRLIDMALAPAHGCGMALNEPGGQMVVDIGGGKVCLAALSMGGIVSWHWSETGGIALDEALARHVERRYQVRISLFEAERVKLEFGSVYPQDRPSTMEVYGLQTRSGLYQKVTLDDSEVRDVLGDACEPLVQALHQGFKAVPPELASDILREGVVLTGGGALLPGLTDFLAERTGLTYRIAHDPINATLRGAQSLLWLGWRSGESDLTASGA